jgi:murein DD-endopeptidase MepM/ murein hydrolase activator NlpD
MTAIFWPLQNNLIRRSSPSNTYGWVRKYANGTPKPHQGWDFTAALQTPVYAIATGQVEFVRERGDYGVQLCISFDFNGARLYAFYAHLGKNVLVSEGEVAGNAPIAFSGDSGNARDMAVADQHLHLEIRTALNPRAQLQDRISPLAVFGKCPLHTPVPG